MHLDTDKSGDEEGIGEGSIDLSAKTVNSIKKIVSGKKKLTVKWSKPAEIYLEQISGYQICYSTVKSFAKAKTVKKTAGKNSVSKVITGLKSHKKYYVKMRAYKKTGEGQTYYSEWTKVKTARTR